MKKYAIHYKNNIIPDNIKLTVDILEGIKRGVIKYYRRTIYRDLQTISKFNLLFFEIEKNLFPH